MPRTASSTNDAIDSLDPGERVSFRVAEAYVDRYIGARKVGLGHADARDDAELEANRIRRITK